MNFISKSANDSFTLIYCYYFFRMLESKSPFFQRQFASGLKLLRNVTSWQGIINDQMLKDLALGALLNRYLLSGLRVCQVSYSFLYNEA